MQVRSQSPGASKIGKLLLGDTFPNHPLHQVKLSPQSVTLSVSGKLRIMHFPTTTIITRTLQQKLLISKVCASWEEEEIIAP